jgi:hypothetical protein
MRERDGEPLEEQLGTPRGRSRHDLRDVHAVDAKVVRPRARLHSNRLDPLLLPTTG